MQAVRLMTTHRSGTFFYGWIICAACSILLFATVGTSSNGLSVFLPYIKSGYGLSNSQISSLVTVRSVFSFAAMLFIGRYYARLGFRKGTAVAALCCAAAYGAYTFSSGYAGFCAGAAFAGLSYGLGAMFPAAIIMHRWFIRHRSLTVGICSAGSSVATIVLPPVLTGMILHVSLRAAFIAAACCGLSIAVLVFAVLREKPADMGLVPLGWEECGQSEKKRQKASRKGASLSGKNTLALVAVSGVMGALATPGFLHLTMLFSEEGFQPMTVAMLFSIVGITMAVFKVVFGEAADILGGYKATAVFCAVWFIGLCLCCLSFLQNVPLAVAAAFLAGSGFPLATVGIPVWANDMSSGDQYDELVRKMQVAFVGGAMLFSPVPGIIANIMGSYVPAYVLFAVLLAFAFALLSRCYARVKRNGAEQPGASGSPGSV